MTRKLKLALNSAEFNLREIAKQFLLLEDHLSDDKKFCRDCIRKHLMLSEAFSEEAMMLEPMGDHFDRSKLLQRQAKLWLLKFENNALDRFDLAQQVRKSRKKLVKFLYS